ncbi:hypothetical protein FB567DRAFT_597344 [Paraphoma chrysanthemicola]|uniref:Transmembrane protein n=1 Tax=Paraphoma chrysanthemicola TaxID=798071 RepID=A0A8K0VTG0_9PLEO|nr:hypothetical protein FB567DRAFT_597344 [Paraphoma chrysanthemicola]
MARFNFPGFATPVHTSEPQHEQNTKKDDVLLHEPCDFMPQSPSPLMIMSASTGRSQTSKDERAVRLLQPGGGERRVPASRMWSAYYDEGEHAVEDTDCGDVGDLELRQPDETCCDVNQTTKTPPRTPLTPSTDTSFASSASFFSDTFVPEAVLRFRWSWIISITLLAAFMVCLLGVAMLSLGGSAALRHASGSGLRWFWWSAVWVSELIEGIIEGVGWVVGRTVGRFGRGFQRGYHFQAMW